MRRFFKFFYLDVVLKVGKKRFLGDGKFIEID
jgi:hypothetical protein